MLSQCFSPDPLENHQESFLFQETRGEEKKGELTGGGESGGSSQTVAFSPLTFT